MEKVVVWVCRVVGRGREGRAVSVSLEQGLVTGMRDVEVKGRF